MDPVLQRKRATRRRREQSEQPTAGALAAVTSDINVTPLVDVVLVLLIIFMVVTPLLHRGVHIELPETTHHSRKNDTGSELVVTVREDGTYLEADRLESTQMVARFKKELTKPIASQNGTTSRPIHLRGDRSLTFGKVRPVLHALHAAGADIIGLAGEEKK